MTIFLQKHIRKGRFVVIHAEFPGVDWKGNEEHIRNTIGGLEYHSVRAGKTFFEMVEHSETLSNPYTERRKLLAHIIQENGTVENLSNCFMGAERSTGVDVSMVRLKKKSTVQRLNFTFDSVNNEKQYEVSEETFKNPIATRDVVGNMIIQYDNLKKNFTEHLKTQEAINFYSQGLTTEYFNMETMMTNLKGTNKQKYNAFCDKMKNEIWTLIIRKTNMEKYMTESVRKNFIMFMNAQGAMDFTIENVQNLIKTLFVNRVNILETAVVDVFDLFTKYHKENRCHVEGWKTNDKWKVNRRVILPYFVTGGYNSNYSTASGKWNEYSDIDKVMCYLTGKSFDSIYKDKELVKEGISKIEDCIKDTRYGDSSLRSSEFFNFRCYKKGTLHIEFKDPLLWEEFNMRACNGKAWLPEAERKQWEESKNMTGLFTQNTK